MSKKPYSDSRWHEPPKTIVTGKVEVKTTYEEEKSWLDGFLESKAIPQGMYEEELDKLKKKYNIKD